MGNVKFGGVNVYKMNLKGKETWTFLLKYGSMIVSIQHK